MFFRELTFSNGELLFHLKMMEGRTAVETNGFERAQRGRPRAFNDKSEQNTIKSLDRALHVLQALAESNGAALSELARTTDQSPATLYRVLVTMEAHELVELDPADQVWRIGAGAFRIGSRYLRRTSLVERARPVLRALMAETGETSNLGIERSGQVLFLSQVETHETIRAFFPPGTLSDMHASGIGKALLSCKSDQTLATHIRTHGLSRYTQNTLCDEAAFLRDMAETRKRGYAIDAEEKNLGMVCVAAPVRDMHGDPVAGISVSGPVSRMSGGRLPGIGEHVRKAAQDLTEAIGGACSTSV